MEDAKKFLEKILDEHTLRDNLSFIAFYIALFENFADHVEDRIKCLFCNETIGTENNRITSKENEEYIRVIKNRIVDDKGNKDTLKSLMIWLKDNGAINEDDYAVFLKAKKQRNIFAHELMESIFHGITEKECKMFIELLTLYKKIDTWWINEIEIPCSFPLKPSSYNKKEVHSVVVELYELMMEVLCIGQSKEIKRCFENSKILDK